MNAAALRSPVRLVSEMMPSIAVGDLVRTGENFHPHFHVIAVTDDRAWIRDTQQGSDHVVAIDRCHRIYPPN